MLSGARRSSEGRDCFFRVISSSQPLHPGGDTGFAPRELWVRVNRKWSKEEVNQSHMTPLDDFLLLSPPTLIFTAARGLLFLWSLTFLTTEFETKLQSLADLSAWTNCSA